MRRPRAERGPAAFSPWLQLHLHVPPAFPTLIRSGPGPRVFQLRVLRPHVRLLMRAAWLRCVTWTRGLQTMEPVAEQDRAQTQPVLTTQCPPPSSCAMSSLLLPPGSTAEAAEASGARTSLCPGLWGQKTPPPSRACQSSGLAQLMQGTSNSLTKAFICIWCAFAYVRSPLC